MRHLVVFMDIMNISESGWQQWGKNFSVKGKGHKIQQILSISYELTMEYIIAKFSAYSIRDDNWKIPIDCDKFHMKHDVTILLT